MPVSTQLRQSTPSATRSAPRRHAFICLAMGALAMLLIPACGEEEQVAAPTPQPFELKVVVEDDAQNPVVKAPVILDGNTVGYTDKDGVYKAELLELVGAEVTVGIGAMDAYLVPDSAQITEVLKRVKTIEGYSNTPVVLQATLHSVRNDYLIWLDTDCAEEVDARHCQDLPVFYNGEEVARTDKEGRAHFDIKGVPDQTVEVSLKTPRYTPAEGDTEDDFFELHPEDPSYQITLGYGAEVLLLKQTFTDPKAAKRLAAKRSRRKRARRRAARVRKVKKKKAAKKAAKKAGVIDLW